MIKLIIVISLLFTFNKTFTIYPEKPSDKYDVDTYYAAFRNMRNNF